MTKALPSLVDRIAASYPPTAAQTPQEERVSHFTVIQHFAWVQRFAPGTATLADIEAQHAEGCTR